MIGKNLGNLVQEGTLRVLHHPCVTQPHKNFAAKFNLPSLATLKTSSTTTSPLLLLAGLLTHNRYNSAQCRPRDPTRLGTLSTLLPKIRLFILENALYPSITVLHPHPRFCRISRSLRESDYLAIFRTSRAINGEALDFIYANTVFRYATNAAY